MPRGQRLALVQAHQNSFAARNIGLLTIDEARRIANGIVRLPAFLADQYGFAAARMVPLRREGADGFQCLCRDYYDPEHDPHGSCIQ